MYAELQTTTNFSFLRGASHVEELFARAAVLGLSALGITDRGSLAGIVRAHQRAEEAKVRLIVGTRLDLTDGPSVLVYPTDQPAYARLCRLLTLGKSRAGKGSCDLCWNDLAAAGEGMIAILCSPPASEILRRLKAGFGDRAYLALTIRRRPNDAIRLHHEAELARAADVPTVATGDVLYHAPGRHILADVLTCIREGRTIDEIGRDRDQAGDRHLKPPEEMARLFARHPEAVERSIEIANRCRFSLNELRYQYPHEVCIAGLMPEAPGRHAPGVGGAATCAINEIPAARQQTRESIIRTAGIAAQQRLERLTWESVATRYPGGTPEDVTKQLRHELALIAQLEYAPYFLTVHAIVRFARSKGILCQGRGSAANSAVCYVLGITSVDPTRSGLLFERFVSLERREPPDIDVDFEHERREEVIQWIYDTYGRDRAALCATVIRYRGRGAVRDVGKAMGLPEDVTGALSTQISHWGSDGLDEDRAAELNLNLDDRRLRLTIELAQTLIGFPRHLSQHPGGFVLTEDRLDDLVPIEPAAMINRQVIEWDKDDIDALRFMKVDVLGLGMLGCLRRAFDLLKQHKQLDLDLASIPAEDPATYAMIRKADTIGTFQIESRAQMSMLPRLKPKTFYDIVIQVAIVRPGPIQGDMVHPYLRRREGLEQVEYPTPELRRVLEKTLGVPLFQEQAMQVAIVCAGFTPGEADALRRSMATFKFTGGVSHFREKMIKGMLERGYTEEFAGQIFSRIEGFGSYGFPESHAASFALIAFASAWLKCHHPDVFCCALLNAQPMGFYAPAQIVRDAELHGVEVRPACINASVWDCTIEQNAVRLGFRMVKGLAEAHAGSIVAVRAAPDVTHARAAPDATHARAAPDVTHARAAPYKSISDVHRRAGVPVAALERLAEADSFHSLNLQRRQAIWAIRGLSNTSLPLFEHADSETNEPEVGLPAMTEGRQVVEDYRSVGLTLRDHPVSFLRTTLDHRRITRCADLSRCRDGIRLTVAGIVLVRQRPGSAKGVLFVTIEDETGHANLIVWPSVFDRQRRILLSATMLACRGKLQKEGEVIHLVADEISDLSALLRGVGDATRAIRLSTRDFR